ncbi:tetratricopeptide repeat protein [Bacillus velezensis]
MSIPEVEVLPYQYDSTDINNWYLAIKNGNIPLAEKMKKKVKRKYKYIGEVNKDIDVYIKLLKLRHEIMLSYLNPDSMSDIEQAFDALIKTKASFKSNNLSEMIEFYFSFFTGMYHFRTRDLVEALIYYREAEKHLDRLDNTLIRDKAEFYFKISEAYYYMKETFFSMNYANRAYNIFKKQIDAHGNLTCGREMVQCQFVIFGNWLDKMCYEDALETAQKALKDAIKIGERHLIGSAHFNIGLCYDYLGELDKAENHFQVSYEIHKRQKHIYEAKSIFNLAYVKAKRNDLKAATALYKEGKILAQRHNNQEVIEKLKLVKGMYLSFDLNTLKEVFKFFKAKSMYGDMEEYAVAVAEFLTKKEERHAAVDFYQMAIEARKYIQRGKHLNEE